MVDEQTFNPPLVAAADALAVTTALLFAIAAGNKASHRDAFAQTLGAYGVLSGALRQTLTVVVPLAEALAAGLTVFVDVRVGVAAIGSLLILFTGGAIRARRRGEDPQCGCFTPGASARLGRWTFARNAVLLAACAWALLIGGDGLAWSAPLIITGTALAASVLVIEQAVALRQRALPRRVAIGAVR